MAKKLRVAIIGTGNIGADLLFKVKKSRVLECVLFSGRRSDSPGLSLAKNEGFNVSTDGVEAIVTSAEMIDLVFDATSADSHIQIMERLSGLGIDVINLTPAPTGEYVIPALTQRSNRFSNDSNLITCGGQAGIPIALAIAKNFSRVDYVELASNISSASAGPATRMNLDEYIERTQDAISTYTGVKNVKAILVINPAEPPIHMLTTVYVRGECGSIAGAIESSKEVVREIKGYVPGYELILEPTQVSNAVIATVKVTGNGDYLPAYAGNLDIITASAVEMAERRLHA